MAVTINGKIPPSLLEVYVGLDTSTKTGLVLMQKDGTVYDARNLRQASDRTRNKVKQKRNPYDRLAAVENELNDLLCNQHIKVVGAFIEKYAFNLHGKMKQSPDSIITQCRYGEMIRNVLWEQDIPMTEVTPPQLKMYALGSGKGGKDEIRLAVFKNWNEEFKTDDECDAFVLARMCRDLYEGVEVTKYRADVLDKVWNADHNETFRNSIDF